MDSSVARRRRTWFFALAVVVAGLFTVLGQLDRVLIDGDYPNGPGGGIAHLHEAESVGDWGTDRATGLPGSAEDDVVAARIHTSPRWIAVAFILLDFLLIAAYTALLALLARRLSDLVPPGGRWSGALRRMLGIALALTVALACVDGLENVAQLLILFRLDLLAPALPLLTGAKWLLLGLVVLGCAVAGARLVRDGGSTKTRGVLRTAAVLRFQIVAVVLFALLLHGSPQAADAILRWGVSDGWWIVAVGVGLTLLLTTALFVTARNGAHADEAEYRPPLPAIPLGVAGIALGAVALTVGFWGDREGAGLLVLGGALFLIALLSLPRALNAIPPFRPRSPRGPPTGGRRSCCRRCSPRPRRCCSASRSSSRRWGSSPCSGSSFSCTGWRWPRSEWRCWRPRSWSSTAGSPAARGPARLGWSGWSWRASPRWRWRW